MCVRHNQYVVKREKVKENILKYQGKVMTFWQNRNICSIQLQKMMTLSKIIPISRSVGLEPTLPEGIWFLVRRLNHSAMTAYIHYHFYWNKYETCLKHSPTPSPIYNFSELKFKDQQNFLKTFLKHVSDISNSGAARAPKVRGVRKPNLPPIFKEFTFYCIFIRQFFGFFKVRGVSWPLDSDPPFTTPLLCDHS